MVLKMSKPVILTGLRANNNLHIGNYFGALLPMIDMAVSHANDYTINLFLPDLHSFTTPIDHNQLQTQIWNTLRMYVAAGLPLNQASIRIYRQSYVPAHSETAWILDNFTGFGEMSRMTQFKDKSAKLSADRVSVGLFNYPVLMAADILLYHADYVPVGDDQTQHLEFVRDIATRINNQFGEVFTVPKPVKEQHAFFGKDQGLRIKDLVDPTKKMSKSDDSGRGIIFLSDDPEDAVKKIMSATTDSEGVIRLNATKQPGIANLLQIQALLLQQPLEETARHWEGKTSYGELKQAVAELVRQFLSDLQGALKDVDDNELAAKLTADEVAVNDLANATLYRLQQAVGLRSA